MILDDKNIANNIKNMICKLKIIQRMELKTVDRVRKKNIVID